MAVARNARGTANILTRMVAALHGPRVASPCTRSPSHPFSAAPQIARPFSSSAAPWRSCGMLPIGRNSTPSAPLYLPVIIMRSYSKRPKKWQGGLHAYVQVEPGAPCPPYSPNAGSVKKRKHNKRMAQRHAFVKAQAQQRKQETKAAVIKRDAARRKRWREGAARAQLWAKHLRQQQEKSISA